MIRELTIDNYRSFDHFELRGLGRVNLLVGCNNSGKTSVLEAIQLLALSDFSALWSVSSRRGERVWDDSDSRSVRSEVDVRHLFHGHDIVNGSEFRISSNNSGETETFLVRIVVAPRERDLFSDSSVGTGGEDDLFGGPSWHLHVEGTSVPELPPIPLSDRGGFTSDMIRRFATARPEGMRPVRFIATAGLSIDQVIGMFEDIVLTPNEELVIEALKKIEPSIERLATTGRESRRGFPGERGGFVAKCEGVNQRIPIGSLGDGMWRMLGLALGLVKAEHGFLLVDEIDTGLHFTVMAEMWKLLYSVAEQLQVQVFATTHSRDCYESLAAIAHQSVTEENQVTIQRLERRKSEAVAFTEQQIIVAAERGIEVR